MIWPLRLVPTLVLVLVIAGPGCDQAADTGASMPPFSEALQRDQDYYRMRFLPHGYPGKEGGFAHPIYGAYVLEDYLNQYEEAPTKRLREAIAIVARASVNRMENFRGTLVFWYAADPNVARAYRRHYSGLTQAYYATALHRAGTVLRDRSLGGAAERVFASLLVPAEEGGVYYRSDLGVTVAEVPQEPNSWILNGWQSILFSVNEYARMSGSRRASQLFAESARTMARMLPLYDAASVKNSRYGLTGFAYVRLEFADPVDRLVDVEHVVPREGAFAVPRGNLRRWQDHVVPSDIGPDGTPATRNVRLNLVLSRASYPAPNVVRARVRGAAASKVRLSVNAGRYDPLSSSPVDEDWVPVADAPVPAGESMVELRIPWSRATELIGYPTNFKKRLGGKQVNVYHPVHIKRLRELHAATRLSPFARWAERWNVAICQWSQMPLYRGLYVRDYRRGADPSGPSAFCAERRSR